MAVYGWEFLTVYHLPDKSCKYFFCIVIVLFLICHVNPPLRMCKGLCEYMGGSPHGESPHFDIL